MGVAQRLFTAFFCVKWLEIMIKNPLKVPKKPILKAKTPLLGRIGVIDVGSNSVRLVVFDGTSRSPTYFYNEKAMCGLGKGLSETGHLSPEGKARALSALHRFVLVADSMEISLLNAVATAAVREATDGPEFQQKILSELGLHLEIIDGAEEARLSAQGVLLGWPDAQGIVCDIGGSSVEFAEIKNGKVGHCLSCLLGPFVLQHIEGGSASRHQLIVDTLKREEKKLSPKSKRLYLVGGSWRAIARLDMARRDYPLSVLHEYRMQPDDVLKTLDWIEGSDPETLKAASGCGAARIALVPLASEVLRQIINIYEPCEIDISSYGVREGVLYEQMPESLRDCDLLIEAARADEQAFARFPGAGDRLFDFLMPLFDTCDAKRLRLIKAACLMHDITWRAHPDYRAEACFDNVTRANLGGLNHGERIFLGLSLLHRYKNSRKGSRFEPFFQLLSREEIQAAEVLGKAMRFGAMLIGKNPSCVGALVWQQDQKMLEFNLTPMGADLFGEVAQTRFAALASAMKAKTKVVY